MLTLTKHNDIRSNRNSTLSEVSDDEEELSE